VSALFRLALPGGAVRLARGPTPEAPTELLGAGRDVDDLMADGGGTPGAALAAALAGPADGPVPDGHRLLAPIAGQEVWASGVTFERSRTARNEEAGPVDIYDRVYAAERPELFLKAAPGRARGPGEAIGIRADSGWDVPEPELALLADPAGRLVAYSVADDVSSRSIEGENPLYLPQAKIFTGSCAIGPALVPVGDAPPFGDLVVSLTITRDGGRLFRDEVPLSAMRRSPAELLGWLYQALDFPLGVALLTGTSIVPPAELTLRAGDLVEGAVPGIGSLVTPVHEVGSRQPRVLAENEVTTARGRPTEAVR